jgi:hypothetical protein
LAFPEPTEGRSCPGAPFLSPSTGTGTSVVVDGERVRICAARPRLAAVVLLPSPEGICRSVRFPSHSPIQASQPEQSLFTKHLKPNAGANCRRRKRFLTRVSRDAASIGREQWPVWRCCGLPRHSPRGAPRRALLAKTLAFRTGYAAAIHTWCADRAAWT